MKKTIAIITAAVVLYLMALGAAWVTSSCLARRSTERMLEQSERVFADSVGDWVYAVLLHACENVERELGGTVTNMPVARMKAMAERFGVDEVNIMDRDGICVASSVPRIVGYDYRVHPDTAAFLALTDGVTRVVSQPFRHGVVNPEAYCKYLGAPFDDGSGFMQLGFEFDRLISSLGNQDAASLQYWRIGRTGHYDYFDGHSRYGISSNVVDGVAIPARENGTRVFCRPFSFAGYRYISILPETEYFQQRNVNFAILALALALVVLSLAFYLRSLARANKAERRRRQMEDEARARDLSLARAIQLSGLEPVAPYRREILSMTFDAMSRPAREVGGDFYDFFFIDSAHVAFVVADVAGKGISAAMYMMRAKNELFNALIAHVDPAEAVAEANWRLSENNEAGMFVTAWVGVVDVVTGVMEYVNAGHDKPFVRRASGGVEKLVARGGRFLGVFPDAKFRSDKLVFTPDDVLFLFTDGVTEALDRNHHLYGEMRLKEVIAGCPADASKMVAAVDADVKEYAAGVEQSDDVTALAIVWHGRPCRLTREFSTADACNGVAMSWLSENVALGAKSARSRLLNAADEVMTNIASYSGASFFTVAAENAPGRTRVVFEDGGRAYNPLTHVDPDVHVPLAERGEGGLGILMAKKLVDSMVYRRDGGRNSLTLVKLDL